MKFLLFLLLISASAYATTVSACGFLNGANTTFTLNQSVAINGSTCFTLNATNVTFDCVGFSITGNSTSSTYGVYDNSKNNGTVKNCVVANFSRGIYFQGTSSSVINTTSATTLAAGNGAIYMGGNYDSVINSSGTSTGGFGIVIVSGTGHIITGSNGTSSTNVALYSGGIRPSVSNSRGTATGSGWGGYIVGSNGTMDNCTLTSATGVGLQCLGGGDNNVTNSIISGKSSSLGAFYFSSGCLRTISTNNTITNNGGAACAISIQGVPSTGHVFKNNTIINSTTLICLGVNASSTFCWNNLTNGTTYVNDLNGTSIYNSSICNNEGNIWGNMGSGNLSGTNNSTGFPNYVVATNGSSYPYNNSTSGGKFVCSFAGCGDYAPLFPYASAPANTCTCPVAGGVFSPLYQDNCNLTSFCTASDFNLTGTCGSFSIKSGGFLNSSHCTFFPTTISGCSSFILEDGGGHACPMQ